MKLMMTGLGLAMLLAGCASSPTAPLAPQAPQMRSDLAQQCVNLAKASVPNARIVSATLEQAGILKIDLPTIGGDYAVPEHCNIMGRINERTGVDGKPYYIGFNLRLPTKWNGRFFYQGGGGTDGIYRPATGWLPAANQLEVPGALSRGYAVVSSDAGHQNEPGPLGGFLFGFDPQARRDHGFNSVPAVNAASHQLIKEAYGVPSKYNYFVGCSNGGRQGMMATQRTPDLFHGVLAGAPAHNLTNAASEAALQVQLMASVAPKANNGKPILGSALSRDDLRVLSDGMLQACDALDGVIDGMIFNPQQCNFKASDVACADGQTSECIEPKKAAALDKLFDGQRLPNGRRVYADWPYDPGVNSMGWIVWRLGSNPMAMPPNAINAGLIPGSLAYNFFAPPITTIKDMSELYDFTLGFNAERDLPKMQSKWGSNESGEELVNATSTDLSKYKGKLIMWHGMADPIFSANDTTRYFKLLTAAQGEQKTQDMARLYLMPGVNHCRGGEGLDKFELFQPLVDWVEKGVAPGAVVLENRKGGPFPGMSRPACAYPKQAHYLGTGDSNNANHFICK